MKISAVVPVRKGSQRVPNKNLRNFANSNLLEIKIEILKQVTKIDEIVINTDSDEAIEIAKKHKVNFHRREPYFASSECSGSDFFKHLGETTDCDYFLYAPATSPFISTKLYESCIDKFFSQKIYDSAATVSLIKQHLWLNGKPINYEINNHPNSQDLPNIYALNFGVNLISRNLLIKMKNIIGPNPLLIEISDIEGRDIDTPLDFFIAEQLYNKFLITGDISQNTII